MEKFRIAMKKISNFSLKTCFFGWNWLRIWNWNRSKHDFLIKKFQRNENFVYFRQVFFVFFLFNRRKNFIFTLIEFDKSCLVEVVFCFFVIRWRQKKFSLFQLKLFFCFFVNEKSFYYFSWNCLPSTIANFNQNMAIF